MAVASLCILCELGGCRQDLAPVPCHVGGPHAAGTPAPPSHTAAQTAEDCLMLWKLTRVGEVGMDMARATRARMECLSCHRCHRFRTAERTWGCKTGDIRSPRGHSEAPATHILCFPTQNATKMLGFRLSLCLLARKGADPPHLTPGAHLTVQKAVED